MMDSWMYGNASTTHHGLTDRTSVFSVDVTTHFYVGPNIECRDVHNYTPSMQCEFVEAADQCQIADGLVHYTQLIYCVLRPQLVPLAIVLLLMWLSFLFTAMAVSADDFFCPQLVVISKLLRMSDNIAGVTLMALGNGAPDVFSAIAAIRNSRNGEIGLAIGALVGAGVFVTTVVSGSICLIKPFHMAERPFLRDVIFYIAAMFMTYCVLNNRYISIGESIGYIVMYICYVAVVIIGRYIYQRQRARNNTQTDDDIDQHPDAEYNDVIVQDASLANDNVLVSPVHTADLATRTSFDHGQSSEYARMNQGLINSEVIGEDGEPSEYTPLIGAVCYNEVYQPPTRQFLRSITPINTEQFKNARLWNKIYMVFKAPALFILNLAIPVVDLDAPRNGWHRYLNAMHCISSPMMTLAVTKPDYFTYKIGGAFPVYAICLMLGTALTVTVLFTSKNIEPPRYHVVFAFVGFIASVLWIEAIANEIVNILTTLGIVFSASSAILGLTLLAWGNSIADYVSDIAMAKNGFPRAGFSACYGGPLFNILLGIGIPFIVLCMSHGGSVSIQFTLMQVVLIFSLLLNLLITLFAVPILKFNVGRAFGIFSLIFYVLFMGLVVITELGVFGDPAQSWQF